MAGGMENMSMAPYLVPQARQGYRMGDGVFVDEMIIDGLQCAMNNYHMGLTAENVAEKYGVTREMQDQIGYESQKRAAAAIAAASSRPRSCRSRSLRRRAIPRSSTPTSTSGPTPLWKASATLKPAFKKDGTVTAGNASGINDAAGRLRGRFTRMGRQERHQASGDPGGVCHCRARSRLYGHGPVLRHHEGHGRRPA